MSPEKNLFETIKVERSGPVLELKINRPKVLNALNQTVLEELESVLMSVDPETRVIVLSGEGDKAFIAGADIAAMEEMTPEIAMAFSMQGQALTRTLEALEQVTVAKVGGFALGGGCEVAMSCDIIIASSNATFGQPEVNLGLIPGFGGTQRLARRVGLPVALDMLLCGKNRSISAEEGFRLGLVSRVCKPEELDDLVNSVVNAILTSAPIAAAEIKRLCRDSEEMSLGAGLNSEASAFANCFSRKEVKDGIQAFLKKSKPPFALKQK